MLARHTASQDATVVAFWDGYGAWPRAWGGLPTARQPGRRYHLFRRPLAEVERLCAEAPAVRYALDGPTSSGTITVFVPAGQELPPPPTADEHFARWAPIQWQSPSEWWPADGSLWSSADDVNR